MARSSSSNRSSNALREQWLIKRLEALWAEHSWAVIGLLWVIVFALGCVGFAPLKGPAGEVRSWSDIVYLVLQLIPLQSGMVEGQKSFALEFSRFLAPVLAATTAIKVFTSLFREKIDAFIVRSLYRDHFVVCGLGRKSRFLVTGLKRAGARVVVVERDEDNELLLRCREDRTKVVIGDATDTEILERAGLPRAKRLICVCGDDDTNVEIVLAADGIVSRAGRGLLLSLAHVYSPHLCSLLRSQPAGSDSPSRPRVEFFSIFQVGAWALLNKHTPFAPSHHHGVSSPHILIVGLGWLGQSLLVQLARKWRRCRGNQSDAKVHVTVVDQDAERLTGYVESLFPGLAGLCSLHALNMDIQSRDFQQAGFLGAENGGSMISAGYVCLADQALAVEAALTLQSRWQNANGFIAVCQDDDAGVGKLLENCRRQDGRSVPLHPFPVFDKAWAFAVSFRPDRIRRLRLFHGGVVEEMLAREPLSLQKLARLLHEDYLGYQRGLPVPPTDNKALVEWDKLSEDFKRSNYGQARNLAGRSLESIGCYVLPATDLEPHPFTFSDNDVDDLAREEHERWLKERKAKGWKWGPVRDDERKENPNIREWADLEKNEEGRKLKEYNKKVVEKIPLLLAEVDYEIRRF